MPLETLENPISVIQQAKHGVGLLYNGHALLRLIQRNITTEQIEQALNCHDVEIIRNYPRTGRLCAECLILGKERGGKHLHILVAYPTIEVITAYEPTPPKWINPRDRRTV
jgi:hypothetical protein